MAESSQWNRPKSANGGAQSTKHKAQSTSYANRRGRPFARGLLAALIVVVGGVLAFYFICGQSETPAPTAPKEKKRGKIAEVEPAKVTNKVAAVKEEKPKPIRWVKGLQNAALDDEGRVYFVPRPGHRLVTNGLHRTKPPYQIFKYGYQNELASYLSVPPGTSFVGEFHYSDRWLKEVLETMSLPIEDDENDTPEQRALRAQMRDMMKIIQEEVAKGTDIAQLFKDTRREMQDLGRYRQTLETEIKKIYNDTEMTDQDVEDSIDAANKMLEAKGIEPLKFGRFAKEIIKEGRDMGLNSRFDEIEE